MERCKNCKYWEVPDAYSRNDVRCLPDTGLCKYVVMAFEAREWVETDEEDDSGTDCINYQLKDIYKDQRSFVTDGSDFKAALITRSDFGCVAHSEKQSDLTCTDIAPEGYMDKLLRAIQHCEKLEDDPAVEDPEFN